MREDNRARRATAAECSRACPKPTGRGHKQGLHILATGHLWVRWSKFLAGLPLTRERAGTGESVLQVVGPAERDVEEGIAKIGPFCSVFAAEGRMLGIGSRDHHRIRTSEARDEYP